MAAGGQMEIKHEPDPPRGAFRAYDEEGCVGSMVYVHAGPAVIYVQHTGVERRGQGHGVGGELFAFLVSWARDSHTLIVPQCPFTRKQFQKHPETQDVLR
jgi:uncharacterized protein